MQLCFYWPETHANQVREAVGIAGTGKVERYSFCSFSSIGIGRFKPETEASLFLGRAGMLEVVVEEKAETVCHKEKLEQVLDAIKIAHPYEETIIDIYQVYPIGMK